MDIALSTMSRDSRADKFSNGLHLAIAGNIGAGKTTLVKMLAKEYGWKANLEAVDNNPYLKDFYDDMRKWAFPLQIYFLHSRFNQVLEAKEKKQTIIQDRTIYEDAYIFAKNLHQSGLMAQRDFENYFSLFQTMCHLTQAPDLLIYLKASVPKLLKQIAKRGRDYELDIDPNYLHALNKNYEEWISDYTEGKLVIIESDDLDFVENEADFSMIKNLIEEKLLSK
ncbi:MAG: deoxynucleoside kinase [Bacteroidia bacterium]|nr:deoxynucleoside kinase [Bacteroidia bacterium]